MSDDPIFAALIRWEASQARFEASFAPLAGSQARLEASDVKLEASLAAVQSGQVALRTEIMARIDRLQNTVEAMRDDITVNFGHADRVEKIAMSASAEVRALGGEVAAMERQIRWLRSDLDEMKRGA